MSHQIKNSSKEIKLFKKMEILEFSTIFEMSNPPEWLNSRFKLTKEIIKELENRLTEIVQSKEWGEKE